MTTKRPQRTGVGVRLPADLHAALVAAADERDLSVNYLVVAAVKDFLPRLIPVEEFSLTRKDQP